MSVDDAQRQTLSSLADYRSQLEAEADPTEPAWVLEHTYEKKRRELEEAGKELEERLDEVRKKEAERRKAKEDGRERKRMVSDSWGRKGQTQKVARKLTLILHYHCLIQRPSIGGGNTELDDDQFLPTDPSSVTQNYEEDNLSPAVKALMAQFALSFLLVPVSPALCHHI